MKLDKTMLVLLVINFTESLGYSIIIPVLPFLAKSLGLNELLIGLIFATFALSQLLSAPFIGFFSDKFGRKTALIFCQIGTLAGYLCLVLSSNFWVLMISRLVDGFSGGNVTITHTIVVDVYDEKNQEKAFNLLAICTGAAILVGPVVASLLIGFGLNLLLFLAVLLSVIALVLNIFYLPETLNKLSSKNSVPNLSEILKPLLNQNLRSIFTIKCIQETLVNCFLITLPLFVSKLLGYNAKESGYLLSLYFLYSLLFQITIQPRLFKIKNKKNLVIYSFSFYLIGFGLNMLVLNFYGVILAGLFFMAGLTILNPLFNLLVSKEITEDKKGLSFGLNQLVSSLGQIVGPVIGYISLYFDVRIFLISCFILTLVALSLTRKLKTYV